MESLTLKELDFRLQKSTGPSSGGVASIDCPGVSSSEVCAICLRCHFSGVREGGGQGGPWPPHFLSYNSST